MSLYWTFRSMNENILRSQSFFSKYIRMKGDVCSYEFLTLCSNLSPLPAPHKVQKMFSNSLLFSMFNVRM